MRALSSAKGVGPLAGAPQTEGLLRGWERAGDCSGWDGASIARASAAGAFVAGAFGPALLMELLSSMLSKGIGPFRPF